MPIKRFSDPTTFNADLSALLASTPGRVFVVVFASEDAQTGQSWCPDCVIAHPKIRKGVNGVEGAVILTDEFRWRSPASFFRTHPIFKTTKVPTLYEVGKNGEVLQQLIEAEAYDDALLAKFFK
ncbi:hypothetical protein BC829DRAFT_415034 [Chytridium lagenaria]|nr:hypothetical protein BC829DRAFT_415034 [Chytridium lagenaria]